MGLQFGLEDVIANSQGNCLAIRNTRCLKKPGRFISHLRLAFKVAGYNARLRVDADKRRCLRVVQVEPRQFSAKRLDVRCNHMTGIPLRVGKRLQLFRVNPDTEVPSVFIGVVLLPALGQQRPVVVVTVSLMAPRSMWQPVPVSSSETRPTFRAFLTRRKSVRALARLRPLPSGSGCLARNARWLIIFGAVLWLSWPMAVVICRADRVL